MLIASVTDLGKNANPIRELAKGVKNNTEQMNSSDRKSLAFE